MTIKYETSLAVSNYLSEEFLQGTNASDRKYAFDDAKNAIADVMIEAEVELKEMGLTGFKVIDATFIEFDSPNPHHAGAYFEVSVENLSQEVFDKAFNKFHGID